MSTFTGRVGGDVRKHNFSSVQFISVAQSCLTLWPHESQHARPPCPSPSPGVHSDSRPLSLWCHPAISSSVVPFSSCPQSLPASESFPMSQPFAWGGQSTGVSALASFLPKNTQGWPPSEWTGWISLQSQGLSRVFSNTTVQKHQFFGAQPSSQSNSHSHTRPQDSYYKTLSIISILHCSSMGLPVSSLPLEPIGKLAARLLVVDIRVGAPVSFQLRRLAQGRHGTCLSPLTGPCDPMRWGVGYL